jgi:hypothetical protein
MTLKIQKFVPNDREYPIYEVIDDENNVLFDVSRTDSGAYEMMIQKDGAWRALPLHEVLQLIEQARALLEQEG